MEKSGKWQHFCELQWATRCDLGSNTPQHWQLYKQVDHAYTKDNQNGKFEFFVWVGNKNGPFGGWENEDLLL